MKATLSQLIAPLLTVLLIAGATWWWYANMEKRWDAQTETSSEATKNPMLGATRLLARHRHPVTIEETLSLALFKPIPAGTLILAGNSGVMTAPQSNRLLTWVAAGNTLIVSPMRAGEVEPGADDNRGKDGVKPPPNVRKGAALFRPAANMQADPLGEHFGVAQVAASRPDQICRRVGMPAVAVAPNQPDKVSFIDCVASITLPDAAYPLRIDAAEANLGSRRETREMLFSDDDAKAVRVFAHGKGRVVFIAKNYFANQDLQLYDHAELLLDLVELNRDAAAVLIVQRPDVPTWYRALWAMVPLAIVALGAALLLWAWAAVRRFGPLLPERDLQRRSLLEHVDASSRWLWKTAKGRAVLLSAAREATDKILLRRVPELQKLTLDEKIAQLALQAKLSQSELAGALRSPPSSRPLEFTRQIRTLQRLRKHFDPVA